MEHRNTVALTACIAETKPLRYTPAGLPALDLLLEHASRQTEAGVQREVSAAVKAIAFGALAERLARQALGSLWTFQGFLATPRNGKGLVFHIQDIQQD
ncbi:primosomal replication protein N [Paracidovorax anthurii]|uniref:Replication restart protein PriB n=1 Tax=Paracidovorax anthurii TaxID=78229 RepID=A0A328Z7I8_9BURK|nr:primosomal replication protein N [Paracidovorax anthurii]RAR81819.1 restart primosome assembly protein PriB [Paracidovorax anthurii]